MTDSTTALRSTILPVIADGAGLFTWDIVADRVSGDPEMARLFFLDPQQLSNGVAVELLINRMHSDDRERVAKSLHTAILNGSLYRELYRVEGADGEYFYVLCLARCFGYENGLPTVCSGFVCEMNTLDATPKVTHSAADNVIQFRQPGT